MTDKDPFAAPADAVLPYIPAAWRAAAVRADSLVIDVEDNVKLHADKDLTAQQASLRDWGFTRQVIVRRANRQVIIGNGSVLAAMRNGWEYVPVDFRDLTEAQARTLGAADNMLGTLADWNEKAVERLLADIPAFDMGTLDLDLSTLCGDVLGRLTILEEEGSGVRSQQSGKTEESGVRDQGSEEAKKKPAIDIQLSRRIVVTCPNEAAQITLMSELMNRGYECRVSTVRAN